MPRTPASKSTKFKSATEAAEVRLPRHRQVYEALMGDIVSGRLQPGDRLPTEAELAKSFSASRSTVARAMRDLKSRGLLLRQRGGGTHLAKQDTRRIALFAPYTSTPSELGFIGGQIHGHLSELAAQRGDHLRLQLLARPESGDHHDEMLAAAQTLIQQSVSGVFYYPVELPQDQMHYNQLVVDKLRSAGIAVVAIDRDIVSFPQRSALPLVTYDNRRAGYLLADHMVRQGCKRIVFVGLPFVSSVASDRMRGYLEALADHRLPIDYALIVSAQLDELTADFVKDIVERLKPDGIVCKQDHYAALISRHLSGMGVTIGKDIRLAGFDNQPFAGLLTVPLTTIRFPFEPFVRVCYDRLTAQMDDASAASLGMSLIDVELVVRASTTGEATDA
ncbi:MAG: GntR family transcriptional regulator [Tepidisphaeraceae bacterium]